MKSCAVAPATRQILTRDEAWTAEARAFAARACRAAASKQTQVTSAISLSSVTKSYWTYARPGDRLADAAASLLGRRVGQPFQALSDVTLDIKQGQATGLIGRNGAGKSTLLQIIAGTLKPSSGSTIVNGRVAAMIELGAGFNPEFTGRENIELSAALAGLSAKEVRARMNSILDFAAIGDFIDQPVKIYSSGMFARLAFAVCAHVDADILLVDEILSVGDAAFNRKCSDFIERFKANGTVVFTSHSMAAVQAMCERAVWLEGGRVHADGAAEGICAQYLAESVAPAPMPPAKVPSERSPFAMIKQRSFADAKPADVVEIFPFDPSAPWFGQGGAKVTNVAFHNSENVTPDKVSSGDAVELRIECEAQAPLERVLIGFQVRDEVGQVVFAQNTHLKYQDRPFMAAAGDKFRARFGFVFPELRAGLYSLVVAITDGTQTVNIHHQWITDAMFLRVTNSRVRRGVVGLSLRSAGLRLLSETSVG
jgi:lipopolysaccharide transport system ATP-binding protein